MLIQQLDCTYCMVPFKQGHHFSSSDMIRYCMCIYPNLIKSYLILYSAININLDERVGRMRKEMYHYSLTPSDNYIVVVATERVSLIIISIMMIQRGNVRKKKTHESCEEQKREQKASCASSPNFRG